MLRGVIQYIAAPEEMARQMKSVIAQANTDAVEFWHNVFVAGHFTEAGAKKYSYKPRAGQEESSMVYYGAGKLRNNPKYYWLKWRKFHTHDPLVKTGASKEAALYGAFKITSSSNRATGAFLSLDRYFYQYRIDLNQPDKAAELVSVISDEIDAMARVHGKSVTDQLDQIKTAKSFEPAIWI